MKKLKIIILAIILVITLTFGIYGLIKVFRPKASGIYIDTSPASTVFLDGTQVGKTPFRTDNVEPGSVVVRLVPDSFETPLAPYDTKIDLVEGVETVIKKEFGALSELSSLEIISFEKIASDETRLTLVTSPEGAQILIDDAVKAISPYVTKSLSVGDHEINLEIIGYVSKTIKVKTIKGYNLTIFVELKIDEDYQQKQKESLVREEEKMVEILSTPVGFLRVRSEPSTTSQEVGTVEPGDRFKMLETDEEEQWYKIEHIEGEVGWVTSQYAQIIEVEQDEEDSKDVDEGEEENESANEQDSEPLDMSDTPVED